MKTIKLISAVIGVSAALGGCGFRQDEGQTKVKYFLKDAGSAEFRNSRKVIGKPDFKEGIFCGEVNSKNSYGALTGFKRYVVIDRLVVVEGETGSIYDVFDKEPDAIKNIQKVNAELALDVLNKRAIGKNLALKLTDGKVHNITAFDLAWNENCE